MRRCHRMIYCYDERFGQWHVPDLTAYVPHERGYFVVKTNREGMRSCRDYPQAHPSVSGRILLLGDSFTEGEGVHNEERFSDLLERSIPGLEVLNLGLDGSGTDQQLLIGEWFGERYEADLILWCPFVENIRRITLPYWLVLDRMTGKPLLIPKPYFTLEEGKLRERHLPVPKERFFLEEAPEELKALFGWYDSLHPIRRWLGRFSDPLKSWLQKAAGHQPFPQYDSPESPGWRLTQAFLERLLEKAGNRTLVLAPLPSFHYIEGISRPVYRSRYQEFAQRHPEAVFLDLLPYFQAHPPPERRRFRFAADVHYTPAAHQVTAKALAQELTLRNLIRPPVEVS